MTDTAIQLRSANDDDLDAVRRLLGAAGLTDNDLAMQFGPQFVVAHATHIDRIVGAAGVELYGTGDNRCGLFRSAVVDAEWRGTGLGAALTENRIRWAEQEGVHTLFLLTQTAADYWPRFGFERIARDSAPATLQEAHEWKSGCPASAVAMRRVLTPT
jgi:amino-acid N-acetyltransferase